MPDFIPQADAAFDTWFDGFRAYFAANYAPLGFAEADAEIVAEAYAVWNEALMTQFAAVAAAQGATRQKQLRKASAVEVIRRYAREIQASPTTTDVQRAGLGITIPDTSRAPTPAPSDAPHLDLDWSQRGRVTIHAGTNPTNEQTNKLAPSARMLILQFRTQGGPWEFLAVTSSSPFVHVVGGSSPAALEYRAAYANARGAQGPWSAAVSAYVTPAA